MFRKNRSASQPPAPPTPSAATAAAQAFLKRQSSNASLSSAAAAAALRSHTASPVPLGEIQTRRMVRRGSNASYTSDAGSIRQPFSSGVQRKSSTASMTERSFRSPSPGMRNAVPPVPNIPPIPNKSHRRIGSSEPDPSPGPRYASPAPSIGRSDGQDTRPMSPARKVAIKPTLGKVPEAGEPAHVNFSRPMSPELRSAPKSILKQRPASSLGFSSAEAVRAQQQARAVPKKLVFDRNSRTMVEVPVAGPFASTSAHLDNSTSAGATAAAVLAASGTTQPSAVGAPKKARVAISENTAPDAAQATGSVPRPASVAQAQRPVNSMSTTPATSSKAAPVKANIAPVQKPKVSTVPPPSADQIRIFQTRAASLLARPLTEHATPVQAPATRAVSSTAESNEPQYVPATIADATNQKTSSNHALSPRTTESGTSEAKPSASLRVNGTNLTRTPSVSPTRSAHFSSTPLLKAVIHEPPPRSISPAKSAMKGHARSGSPENAGKTTISDTSSIRSFVSEEGSTAGQRKKKTTRVSFDSQPVTVGEAASTLSSNTIPEPPNKTGSEEIAPSASDIMAPRPTLPFFGSVRNRKDDRGEAALPPAASAPQTSSSRPTMAPKSAIAESLAASGAPVISQDFAVPADHVEVGPTDPFAVPEISVMPASPNLEENDRQLGASNMTPALTSMQDRKANSRLENQKLPSEATNDENDSDGTAELYEDATEDQTDGQVGKFVSLNAILETTAIGPEPSNATANGHSASVPAMSMAREVTVSSDNADHEDEEDWDTVRAYWSSLSDQTKQQLEAAAAPIPGEENLTDPDSPRSPKLTTSAAINQSESLPPWPDQEYQQSVKSQRGASATVVSPTGERSNTISPPGSPAIDQSNPKRSNLANVPDAAATNGNSSQIRNAFKNPLKPKLSRTASGDSTDSESSFRRKRPVSKAAQDGRYSMKRSMRIAPESAPDARTMSPTPPRGGVKSLRAPSPSEYSIRKPMRMSVRGSDSAAATLRGPPIEPKSSGFMGLGKSKPKPKIAARGGGFRSRFADSSDEEDGTGFTSRFAESDEDEAPSSPITTKLTPVRGIPRRADFTEGDSTDLSDSDDGGRARPQSKNVGLLAKTLKSNKPSPIVTAANGNGTSTALAAGTMRSKVETTGTAPDSPSAKRRSFFGLVKKKRSESTATIESPIGAPQSPVTAHSPVAAGTIGTPTKVSPSSPTANNATGAVAEPVTTPMTTPERPQSRLARSLRSHSREPSRSRPLSIFGRMSSYHGDTTVTSQTGYTKDTFPFAPPPIPNQYIESYSAGRPTTSDGIANSRSTSIRPSLSEKRQSSMTVPPASVRGNRQPVISERTGKKKKFQGLRRVFGLHD